ncbi:MAG: PilZ domain-containing protein [Methylococcales bacterium]
MQKSFEKRRFIRMDLSCELMYRLPDTMRLIKGSCKNLSNSGILFTAFQNIDAGVVLEIELASMDEIVSPPMKALVEVVSSRFVNAGTYDVAAEIKGFK